LVSYQPMTIAHFNGNIIGLDHLRLSNLTTVWLSVFWVVHPSVRWSHKRKLDATHHKFQRRLLGITWKDKVRNEDIRNQTKLQIMDLIIKERRLRWLGHGYLYNSCYYIGLHGWDMYWLLSMEDDRIPKQATRWQMDSYTRRRAGRPRSNWIATVTRDLKSIGMAWEDAEQAAVDREDWCGRVAQCVFDTGWTKV